MVRLNLTAAFAALALLASCSRQPDFAGAWNAETPETVVSGTPAIPSLSTVNRISFGDGGGDGGSVTLTCALSGSFVVEADSLATDTRGFNAIATVGGSWSYADDGDHAGLLVAFDLSSLRVKVDNTLAFPEGTAPRLEAAQRHAVASDLSRYSVIGDIEVSKDGRSMSFEADNPAASMVFHRARIQ